MTLPFKLVSADSHIIEPPDLWTSRIDQPFRDRAPRLVRTDSGDCWVGGDHTVQTGLISTKPKYENPDARFGNEGGRWEDVPESAHDPAARAAELDREGIEAELLYTTFGLTLFALDD